LLLIKPSYYFVGMKSQNSNQEFCEKIDRKLSEMLSSSPISKNVRGQYDYKKDKEAADKGENFIISHLESLGFKFVRKSVKNDKKEHREFDLLMSYNKREIMYEVKTDMYPDTGNLVVEFECRGNPSGISVTKADYFTTYFTKLGEIWNIKTSDLKSLISKNELRKVPGGDDKKTMMYLIPRAMFRDFFKVHKIQ
jgi:hypothetical protein